MRRAHVRWFAPFGVVALLITTLGIQGPGVAAPREDPPNIILITTDDQDVQSLRYMPFTRKLLGRQGVSFRQAISSYPLCCPARATIMTGQLAHNHGVLSNTPPAGGYEKLRPLNDRTLPVWLRNAGYRTTFVGKYLNTYGLKDPTEVPAGWDNWNATVRGVYDYDDAWVNENGTLVDRTGEYQTDITQAVTDAAIRHGIERREPFFVWQSNLAPHAACTLNGDGCSWGLPVPAKQDKGDFAGVTLPAERHPNFNERVVVDKPQRIRERPLRNVNALRRRHQANVESLQAVDRNVQATVELLSSLGELENTLIIFTSDNGFLLGQHRYKGKTLPYESSLRVPMLMRGPGAPPGLVSKEMVSLVDVPATIADAAGAEPLLTLDGASLLDVAQGTSKGYEALTIEAGPALPGIPPDEYLYHGVRTGRYTYVEYPVTGERELYDRARDPFQLVNVAYRPTHRRTRAALSTLTAQLSGCSGVTCHPAGIAIPEPDGPEGPVHPDELGSLGAASQVVTVTASRWTAARGRAVAWQRKGRTWRAVRGPWTVKLGREGMSPRATKKLYTTPAGTHRLRSAFGTRRNPGANLGYRRLDADDRWSYDPASPLTYNVLQPGRSPEATWRRRHEVLFSRYPGEFQRGLMAAHNPARGLYWSREDRQRMARRAADVRQGSLLLHTGARVGRHGWVSMPLADMSWLLRWADPAEQGTRLVVGTPGYLRRNL